RFNRPHGLAVGVHFDEACIVGESSRGLGDHHVGHAKADDRMIRINIVALGRRQAFSTADGDKEHEQRKASSSGHLHSSPSLSTPPRPSFASSIPTRTPFRSNLIMYEP